jgi:DNA-binding NarL/FixJ family response regulator
MAHPMDGVPPVQRVGEPRAPIRVLLADSHQLLAQALATALAADAELEVVGAEPLLTTALLRRARPDVLVLSYLLMLTHRAHLVGLRAEFPGLKIIVLTAALDEETLAACIQSGAVGCVVKHQSPVDLGRTIRAAHAGEVLFSPEMLVRLLRRSPDPGPAPRPPARLRAREREVLQALAEGLSAAEVAERLVLSPHTVRSHVKTAMRKLGAHSRMEAVMIAAREGAIALAARQPHGAHGRDAPRTAGPLQRPAGVG